MASTSTTKQSSRFSTLKVFKFTSSKPPPPPPKDGNHLYSSSSKNTSIVSFTNQSISQDSPASNSQPPTSSPQHNSNGNGPLSTRSPSPAPSRVLQQPQQQLEQQRQRQQQQSPPPSVSASTLMPDAASTSSKRSFFRKIPSFRKRSVSKGSRTANTNVDDPLTDDESISSPWNFQHHIHIDDAFHGIPSTWSSALHDIGYSEAEIALIQKGRRNRSPAPSSVQEQYLSTSPPRTQSPTSTALVTPRPRSSSLRRQRSDTSISRSERSLRIGPPPPPPPLPLPPPPQTPQTPQTPQAHNQGLGAPTAPPPTPASGGDAFSKINDAEIPTTPSDAQYVYINHPRLSQNQAVLVHAPVPVIQPVPARPLQHSRSNSAMTATGATPRGGGGGGGSERRLKAQTPPRRQFRVVNDTSFQQGSPPPLYMDDAVRSLSPPPITHEDVMLPRPQEKAISSPPIGRVLALASQNQVVAPSLDLLPVKEVPQPASPSGPEVEEEEAEEEHDGVDEDEEEELNSDHSSGSHHRPRPSALSILPPRLSLRKDTLEDLSSWSASLFSSLPSEPRDSIGSTISGAGALKSSMARRSSQSGPGRRKPSVTLPSIVLHPEVREEDEDEMVHRQEEPNEHEYSHSASPLYHELMGMMQDRAAATNNISPPASDSPASANFQLDAAQSASPGAFGPSRDSQLTIRLDSHRDSSRDSSASSSTVTHATIVRGASIVRRVRADVVTTPPLFTTLKGKERERELAQVQDLQEDEEGDSSSDAAGSDEDCEDEDDEEGMSESPADTLALTSGPNSQENAGGSKSPRFSHLRGSPLPSPSPSPLRASFTQLGDEVQEKEEVRELVQVQEVPEENPYATPPPSAALLPAPRPTIAVTTANLEVSNTGSTSLSLTSMGKEMEGESGAAAAPTFAPTGVAMTRYPTWLAAVVLPLAEFIDDAADPKVIFTDLQEIAQGESGSVYSARAAPSVVQQFHPLTPRSPTQRLPHDSTDSPQVAIKHIPLLRGGSAKLGDLRRELELTRAVRHANILRMERLYVDVPDESLWIGMELMDRSLADVLAAVGEEAAVPASATSTVTGTMVLAGEDNEGAVAPVVVPEKMVARFVWDVLLALSYIRKSHIAHRDVRSDNLLLSRAGVLKLSDFSNAVRSPPGTPKRSDPVGVIYWQAPEMRTGLYDPLKVDVWSLGATTWELVHGDPPLADVQDPRHITGHQLPPVRQPETFSRSFHDFLHLCSQPVASRPDPDELLNAYFIRTACPRSEIVKLLGQCKAIDEQQLFRQSGDSHF